MWDINDSFEARISPKHLHLHKLTCSKVMDREREREKKKRHGQWNQRVCPGFFGTTVPRNYRAIISNGRQLTLLSFIQFGSILIACLLVWHWLDLLRLVCQSARLGPDWADLTWATQDNGFSIHKSITLITPFPWSNQFSARMRDESPCVPATRVSATLKKTSSIKRNAKLGQVGFRKRSRETRVVTLLRQLSVCAILFEVFSGISSPICTWASVSSEASKSATSRAETPATALTADFWAKLQRPRRARWRPPKPSKTQLFWSQRLVWLKKSWEFTHVKDGTKQQGRMGLQSNGFSGTVVGTGHLVHPFQIKPRHSVPPSLACFLMGLLFCGEVQFCSLCWLVAANKLWILKSHLRDRCTFCKRCVFVSWSWKKLARGFQVQALSEWSWIRWDNATNIDSIC